MRFILDNDCLLCRFVSVAVRFGTQVPIEKIIRITSDLHLVQPAGEPIGGVRLRQRLRSLFGLVLLLRHLVQEVLLQSETVDAVLRGLVHQGLLWVQPPVLVALR